MITEQCYFEHVLIFESFTFKYLILYLDKTGNEDAEEQREIYLASCDLTVAPTGPMRQIKGCVLKSTNDEERDIFTPTPETSSWKKCLCCRSCFKTLNDVMFMLAVRCASVTPEKCHSYALCSLLDLVCN